MIETSARKQTYQINTQLTPRRIRFGGGFVHLSAAIGGIGETITDLEVRVCAVYYCTYVGYVRRGRANKVEEVYPAHHRRVKEGELNDSFCLLGVIGNLDNMSQPQLGLISRSRPHDLTSHLLSFFNRRFI